VPTGVGWVTWGADGDAAATEVHASANIASASYPCAVVHGALAVRGVATGV
jgi:hypothetical protein